MSAFSKNLTLSRRSGQKADFLIRRCEKTDLFDILKLRQKIYDDLSDPGLYALVDEEDILESLKLDHCFTVYQDGRLVAFTMMIDNRSSSRNYGTYLDYTPDQQRRCVSLEISIVDESCRGYGLQRYFVELRERVARDLGAAEALVTIGPENKYSLQNLMREGYEIIDTRQMYEGAVRHILRKEL